MAEYPINIASQGVAVLLPQVTSPDTTTLAKFNRKHPVVFAYAHSNYSAAAQCLPPPCQPSAWGVLILQASTELILSPFPNATYNRWLKNAWKKHILLWTV